MCFEGNLLNDSRDVLSDWLDSKKGDTVNEHSVFDQLAKTSVSLVSLLNNFFLFSDTRMNSSLICLVSMFFLPIFSLVFPNTFPRYGR